MEEGARFVHRAAAVAQLLPSPALEPPEEPLDLAPRPLARLVGRGADHWRRGARRVRVGVVRDVIGQAVCGETTV